MEIRFVLDSPYRSQAHFRKTGNDLVDSEARRIMQELAKTHHDRVYFYEDEEALHLVEFETNGSE